MRRKKPLKLTLTKYKVFFFSKSAYQYSCTSSRGLRSCIESHVHVQSLDITLFINSHKVKAGFIICMGIKV